MTRLLRFVSFLACILFAGNAFAAGGSCPSGATYLDPASGSLETLSSLGVTSCYFISAAGSDSNSGTSEASPWLHGPGMPNCTGVCAATTPQPGQGFIFRGGDTWHFGNSSASPFTGIDPNCDGAKTPCGFHLKWSGTSGSPIYFGVDLSWYSGSSWRRPLLNGDNPLSTSGVASCAYDESLESFVMEPYDVAYVIFDNFEMLGMCWSGSAASAKYIGLSTALTNTYRAIENVAFHGWTHVNFSCSESNGEPSGNCDGGTAIGGPSDKALGIGDTYSHIACDGSDSDHRSFFCVFGGGWAIYDSVFQYESNGVVINNMHVFHDNLFQNLDATSDGVAHGNAAEFNVEYRGVNAIYNNIFRNLWSSGCEVTMWETPYATDYAFNNIEYGNPCGGGNYWNEEISLAGDSGWTANLFNNTFVLNIDSPGIAGPPPGTTINFVNNQCITPDGGTVPQCSAYKGTENYITSINSSASLAKAQGYTTSEIFNFAPTASSKATVKTGTNEESFCSALTGSSDPLLQAAGVACQSSTTYACSYNGSTFTVTCSGKSPIARPTNGAWDIGAYQYMPTPSPVGIVTGVVKTN